MTTRTGPAPALECGHCHRRLGKTAGHILTGSKPYSPDRLLCMRCMSQTRPVVAALHRVYYPACAEAWHDMFDHPTAHATRAAAANLLGLWP